MYYYKQLTVIPIELSNALWDLHVFLLLETGKMNTLFYMSILTLPVIFTLIKNTNKSKLKITYASLYLMQITIIYLTKTTSLSVAGSVGIITACIMIVITARNEKEIKKQTINCLFFTYPIICTMPFFISLLLLITSHTNDIISFFMAKFIA